MILEIYHLTQRYNDKIAVEDLNLSVDAGKIYGFIGHNGAGKSTTIKSVVGILPVKEGEILVDGKSIAEHQKACQAVTAYVPDNPDLYGYMTGIEYINFICDIFRVELAKRRERTRYYADLFEITEQLGDLISSYSHGMKQKIALIAAFAHAPRLLVLDEPFVGLDPKASAVLKCVMREHCAAGNAIFFSTHVLEVAQMLCDEIGMLDHGHLLYSGPVTELTQTGTLEDAFLQKLEEHHA